MVDGQIDVGVRGGAELDERAHRARLEHAGQLLAGVMHEVRNPLAVIQGYAQLLHERVSDAADRADLACVLEESRRMGQLIEDMLAFTRRSQGGAESVDLGRVVDAALNLTGHTMKQARIAVVASIGDPAPTVIGNHGTYVQVLLNLLVNARHSLEADEGNRERGISLRSADPGGGRVSLLVSNNGPPIPTEAREAVFEPFFTTKLPGQGSGLGLALCRELLGRYDARIELEGPAERGVTFRLDLPRTG